MNTPDRDLSKMRVVEVTISVQDPSDDVVFDVRAWNNDDGEGWCVEAGNGTGWLYEAHAGYATLKDALTDIGVWERVREALEETRKEAE